jgi:hypothetical protein
VHLETNYSTNTNDSGPQPPPTRVIVAAHCCHHCRFCYIRVANRLLAMANSYVTYIFNYRSMTVRQRLTTATDLLLS